MGRQVVGAETWKPNEDATSLPGGDTQFACSSAAYPRWERSRLWTIPWLWKQTSCFSVKSLPYLLKEQRLYSSLGQIFVFGIFTAYITGWGHAALSCDLYEDPVKMVLEWLTSAFRRFCLCDSMAGQLKVLGGLSSFIFYDYFFLLDKQRCWHWQWSLIFSHLTVP